MSLWAFWSDKNRQQTQPTLPWQPSRILMAALDLMTKDTRAERFAEEATTIFSPCFSPFGIWASEEAIAQTMKRWRSMRTFVTIPVWLTRPVSIGIQVKGALAGIGVLISTQSHHINQHSKEYHLTLIHYLADNWENSKLQSSRKIELV